MSESNHEINFVRANGLKFAYYEAGEGPLVLCFHGFPDTADTWSDLLPRLAQAGYRAVAPFQRGYPPTEIPTDKPETAYSVLELGADVQALIEAFGEETATLIGHDWGAATVLTAESINPEKIRSLVTVAIPHPRGLRPSFRMAWSGRHFLTFQLRKRAVRRLRKNNSALLNALYRRWSPDWDFTETDLAPVKEAFSQPGAVEAALGYYWAFLPDNRGKRGAEVRKVTMRKVTVPSMAVAAATDSLIPIQTYEKCRPAYSGHYEVAVIPRGGHFVHREDPEGFAEAVLRFLEEHDPV